MATPESKNPTNPSKISSESILISPGFRSAAAMAGWDEEALLLASLVVEDTPVRESKHKKRPSTANTNRKRRPKRQSPNTMPAVVLCLDDDEEDLKKDVGLKKKEVDDVVIDDREKRMMKGDGDLGKSDASNKGLLCMDRLREELSCAICLEICFEPSTTQCGHSFCKTCLKRAADKCGKRCPKCRQLISNGRSCSVNTVLWNTIRLLFPEEIEARRSSEASTKSQSPEIETHRVRISNTRTIPRSTSFVAATQVSRPMERENNNRNAIRRRAGLIRSEDDAILALRLQREEFMEAFGDDAREERIFPTIISARANLRAMASRAHHIRTRGR